MKKILFGASAMQQVKNYKRRCHQEGAGDTSLQKRRREKQVTFTSLRGPFIFRLAGRLDFTSAEARVFDPINFGG
jgi:hypothetical protein